MERKIIILFAFITIILLALEISLFYYQKLQTETQIKNLNNEVSRGNYDVTSKNGYSILPGNVKLLFGTGKIDSSSTLFQNVFNVDVSFASPLINEPLYYVLNIDPLAFQQWNGDVYTVSQITKTGARLQFTQKQTTSSSSTQTAQTTLLPYTWIVLGN